MSVNAPDLVGRLYSSNVELLLQQKGSRLRGKVTEGSYKGSQASVVDQVGSISAQQVISRFSAIGRVDAAFERRWISPTDYDLNQLFDSFDELKIISDPKSVYVMNGANAFGRKIDEGIIEAFFGTALTGTTGATSTSATTDGVQQVAVNEGSAASENLTVAKQRRARRHLMAANLDMSSEQLYQGVNAQAHDRLLQEAQVISLDFNEKPVLKEGMVSRFLGFEYVHTELWAVNGSSQRRLPAWAKSGMHLGLWMQPNTDISQRKDLTSHPWQAYSKMSFGATRLEGEKIIEVICAE